MSDDAEFGPWIEHDGKGCPCRGQWVMSENRIGLQAIHIAEGRAVYYDGTPTEITAYTIGSAWEWGAEQRLSDVIRYRLRRPQALRDLITLVETLPAPAPVEVDV